MHGKMENDAAVEMKKAKYCTLARSDAYPMLQARAQMIEQHAWISARWLVLSARIETARMTTAANVYTGTVRIWLLMTLWCSFSFSRLGNVSAMLYEGHVNPKKVTVRSQTWYRYKVRSVKDPNAR